MKNIYKIIIILLCLIILSCDISHNNLVFKYFDVNNKTITMVSGSDPLIFGLKKVLINNNWVISNFNETVDQQSISYDSISTKYLLLSKYDQGKDIILGDFVREYDFKIINVETESEVVLMFGKKRTVKEVLDEFTVIIAGNDEI